MDVVWAGLDGSWRLAAPRGVLPTATCKPAKLGRSPINSYRNTFIGHSD